MASTRVLLISLALMVIAVHYASSENIKCHVCATLESCDKFNNATDEPKMECDTKKDGNKCVKIDNTDGKAVLRGCLAKKDCDMYRYCYGCTKEGCNSGTSLTPMYFVAVIAGAIVKFHY